MELSEADESFHAPGPEEQWSDSLYFGGGNPGQGPILFTRIGLRPNEGRIEGSAGIWLPDGRFALAFAREDARGEVAVGPVRMRCDEPFRRWTIELKGTARVFGRAEDVALDPRSGTELPLAGELEFQAWTAPFEFGTGLGGGVAARHYEQPGSLTGSLTVGGDTHVLDGRGLRDHSWGVRDWQRVPWWRWFGIVVDAGNFLLVNEVGVDGESHRTGGCLMLDGTLAPVVASDSTSELDPDLGCQRRFTVRATDELGREAALEGEAINVAPLRQRRGERLTLVNEGLTRLRWGDHSGLGISEYLLQDQPH